MRLIATCGLFSALCLASSQAGAAIAVPQPGAPAATPVSAAPAPSESIAAVVNGDVITRTDVQARTRLFALSTGLPLSPDVIARLMPQITQQLIDERLRLQEEQRRKVIVTDKEIVDAIANIERRNNMQPGALRAKLAADNVPLSTLFDQTRVQLGWTRVLRDELGARAEISDADITAEQTAEQAQAGQPEYRVGEIFLATNDPTKAADTQRFADTIIAQLHAGAPFSVLAAQFSQSQNALEGGDLGWVRPNQLDPQVDAILKEMPDGAISNPVRVPGGISIITVRGHRTVGKDLATETSLRQVFLPFTTPLEPAAPTEQQKKQLATAQSLQKTLHDCPAMEAAAKQYNGSSRPADPGTVREDALAGPMRALLAGLQPGQASRPLVSNDGIAIIMVCQREQKNMAVSSKEEVGNRLLNERVEAVSRRLVRDLRRRSIITIRG